MDPITENPADIWKRFRDEKTVEQLALEQGWRPMGSIKELYADVMPEDETPEMLNAAIERWRDEDRRRVGA